ncbi:HNH endonuclease [Metabacillus sp. B2-18]|uniref:HNH endonuclease n=1 Tax=Metabacillus sp. B2-18 TaxID=2897333 RepID=UPI001E3A742D|nr:EVE domain-containing protein [Metabacillus sp. B2-18]UGB33158.1 EVE domain-containing protein [Metabacillus sp. B2-18]
MGYANLPGSEWESFFEEQLEKVFEFDQWDEFLSNYQHNQGNKLPMTKRDVQNNTWIFQGNPRQFRINDYLRDNTSIMWSLNQEHFQNVINIGDTVYIWRSDGGQRGTGGIIAKGAVTGTPVMNDDPSPYWNNTDGQEMKIRVPIQIENRLLDDVFINRQELLEHSTLYNLLILRMSNQTNYLISKEQAIILNKLWNEKLMGSNSSSVGFDQEKFNRELTNKTYVKGKETPFYIITVKKFLDHYDKGPFIYEVILLEDHKIVYKATVKDDTSKQLLTPTKHKGMELLFSRNPLVRLEDISMVHYKEDRLKADSWEKEPSQSLKTVFDKLNVKRLSYIIKQDLQAERSQNASFYKDGEVKQYFGNRYERKAINRLRAIEIHGTSCVVCEFNFEQFYGEHGKNFIEIHHIKPLSTLDEVIEIDPEKDLVPVCSNCHRMLHRKRENVLSIEELKGLLRKGISIRN